MSIRSMSRLALVVAASSLATHELQAQGLLDPRTYGFQVQSGLRYWYSNGSHQLNLKDVPGTSPVSRLTWGDVTGHAAETYFRADHKTGFFIKGISGAGSLTGGNLKDEDFAPFITPYSSTNSAPRDGDMSYWNVDLGYTAWKNQTMRLGGFVGYGRWSERMRAFGCAQTAGNGAVCAPTIPDSVLGITETYKWAYGRVGAVGDFKITDRLTLTAEGAYVFGADFDGGDNKHLRPGTLPRRTPIDGEAQGVQLEAVLNYAFTDVFSLGIGARYWRIEPGTGKTHFEVQQPAGLAQVSTVESERYGVFVQGSYKLGGAPAVAGSIKDRPVAAPPHNWAGAYAGINAGSGWGSETTTFTGTGQFITTIASGQTPREQGISTRGIVGGLHAGYNWKFGSIVTGVEAEIAVASLDGANSHTSLGGINTTTERRIDTLGSLRARLGFLIAPDALVYATGGVGFGDTSLSVAVNGCAPACVTGTSSGWATGWVAGAGYETAIARNLTWKTEYLYYDLGERTASAVFNSVPPSLNNGRSDFAVQTVRTGISLKF